MSRATIRRVAILEPAMIFALIMAYIWYLRFAHHQLWIAILGLILVSHVLHRERAQSLGFHTADLVQCVREFAPALGFVSLAILAAGILLRTTRPVTFSDAVASWVAYIPWGIFQQYLLNGYFLNRFDVVLPRRSAAFTASALFAGAHLPNWFLMLVTLLAGYCCARIYLKHRNLYFLGLAHGTVGFLLFLVVPDSVSHHLTVGPGWFLH